MKSQRNHQLTLTQVRIAILIAAGILAVLIAVLILIPVSVAAHQ